MTRHVVLVTYGEPPTAAFGPQLVYSWRILRGLTRTVAPIPQAMVPFIAVARAHARWRSWRTEEYASPLELVTRRQAARVQAALCAMASDIDWQTHVAYEFRAPRLADLLEALPAGDTVDVVPMYVADSAFTHALARRQVARFRDRIDRRAPVTVASSFDAGGLAEIAAAHLREQLRGDAAFSGPKVALVLAAHGTLLEPSTPLETGRVETERLCSAIRDRLTDDFGTIVHGWLNHRRGGRWTEPAVEEAVRHVRAAGFTRIVYFPYGFLADNAESQLEGKVILDSFPDVRVRHLPCLNDSPMLARLVARHLLAST